jgi:hypothetical protein
MTNQPEELNNENERAINEDEQLNDIQAEHVGQFPFVITYRLVSGRDVVVGNSLAQAALLAANGGATNRADVIIPYAYWPRLSYYENEADPINGPAPVYIWDLPVQPGETEYFGIASGVLPLNIGDIGVVQIVSAVVADNAFATRFELFRLNPRTGLYDRVAVQPGELAPLLISGTPNNPLTGRTEVAPPYSWQFVRYYHTIFFIETPGDYIIVQTFQATNYVNPINSTVNPAGLQFITDVTMTICD